MSSTEQMIACIKQWDLIIPMSMQVKLYYSSKAADPFKRSSYTDTLDSMKKSLFNKFSVEEIAEAYALNCMTVFDSRKDSENNYNYTDEVLEAYKYTEQCVLAIEEHIASEKMKAFLNNKFEPEDSKPTRLIKASPSALIKSDAYEIKDEHYAVMILMFVFGWVIHPLISLTGGISWFAISLLEYIQNKNGK